MAKVVPHGRDLRWGRLSEAGRIYLVTAVTHGRQPLFADLNHARALVRCLGYLTGTGAVETLCYVVMPDHLHWLLALGEGHSLSRLVQGVKSYSARHVTALRGETGQVWRRGFHDHALRAEEDVLATARYVAANPVRAGLVARVSDYPHWDAIWL